MSVVSADVCANCGKGGEDDGVLKACTACNMVKYCNREFQIAHRPQHKSECRKRAKELLLNDESDRTCSRCLQSLPHSRFSATQWSKGDEAKCKDCTQTLVRKCAGCKKKVPQAGYSKNQWSKGGKGGKCKDCIESKLVSSNISVEKLDKTEAYRVRKDNSIEPKDRLIKFCELNNIMELGELNGGLILPETVYVPSAGGNDTPITTFITPYKYWGLPANGTDGAKKSVVKMAMKQCQSFYEMDMQWFVANASLVEPFFAEVVEMQQSTPGIILDIKEAISPWQRPDRLSLTEAYQARYGGTITAKDRLIEFCELSGLNHYNTIEREGCAGIPARQTSNRYWGMSPQGEDSDEDLYAWNYFMELDAAWIRGHADLVEACYDEVEAFGYRNIVQMVRNVIQYHLETAGSATAA